jgi:hypothetical protein
LIGNNAIEDAAIAWVLELESCWPGPTGCSFLGAPGDVESPPRVIEVKAFGKTNRGFGLWLETRQIEEARATPTSTSTSSRTSVRVTRRCSH